jgi:hypothetical protein
VYLQVLREMSPLHRSTAPGVKEALDVMPGYRDTEKRLEILQEYRLPSVATEPAVTLAGYIADAVRDGKPIPDDLVDQAAHLTGQLNAHHVALSALQGARAQVASDLNEILQEHIGEVYAAINARLQGVVDEARKLWPVPLDAETAITQERVSDFQHWNELEAEYRSVRAGYQAAMSAEGTIVTGRSWIGCYVANHDDVWPHLARHETGHRYADQSLEDNYQANARPSWPENMHTEGLAWLAANPTAEAWAPTTAEYAAVRSAHGESMAEHSAGIPRNPERAARQRRARARASEASYV